VTPKLRSELRDAVRAVTRVSRKHGGPTGPDLWRLWVMPEACPGATEHAPASFLMGYVSGVADTLDVPLRELLALLPEGRK
jgi:hypothetical protein